MIEAQQEQEYRRLRSTKVFPAVIEIQELAPGCVAEESRRRITVLLDHSVVRQLGWFSWFLAIVALAGRRPVSAIVISILVLAGLLVGIINVTRWLFPRKR